MVIGKVGKTKASVVALVAASLGVVFATPASDAGNGPPLCFGKRATIVGGDGDNTIRGTNGGDVIVSRGGQDRIDAGGGRDRICAGRGNDFAVGETGVDYIRGGRGRDAVLGYPFFLSRPDRGDYLYGGRGSELVESGSGRSRLSAGIYGGRGNDLLNGGKDRDRCEGDTGQDRFRKCERVTGRP